MRQLYIPEMSSVTDTAHFLVQLISNESQRLEWVFDVSSFSTGWNMVTVDLQSPFVSRVNGVAASAGEKVGALDVVTRSTKLNLGFSPGGSALTGDFVFWTDEWHSADSIFELSAVWRADAVAGYREAWVDEESWAPLRNITADGSYQQQLNNVSATGAEISDQWHAGASGKVLDFLLLDTEIDGLRDESDILSPASADSFSYSVGILTPVVWLPQLQHRYQHNVQKKQKLQITSSDYLYESKNTAAESIVLGASYAPIDFAAATYSFTRDWLYVSNSTTDSTGVAAGETQTNLNLHEIHDGSINLKWKRNRISLNIKRDDLYSNPATSPPGPLLSNYTDHMSRLFKPLGEIDPETPLAKRSDSIVTNIFFQRLRFLGLNVNANAAFIETGFDKDERNQTDSGSNAIFLRVPWSLDGDGKYQIIPSMRRAISHRTGFADTPVDKLSGLAASLQPLVMPPFYYLTPLDPSGIIREYDALQLYGPEFAGTLQTSLSTNLSLMYVGQTSLWFAPSRITLSADSRSSFSNGNFTLIRILNSSLGKNLPYKNETISGNFGLNVSYSLTTDYTKKTRRHAGNGLLSLSTRWDTVTMLRISVGIDTSVLQQEIDDPSLALPRAESAPVPTIAEIHDLTELSGRFNFSLNWSQPEGDGRSLPEGVQNILHTEELSVKSSNILSPVDRIERRTVEPFHMRFKHITEIVQSDVFSVKAFFLADTGLGNEIRNGTSTDLPFLAFELGVTAHISF